MTARLNTPPAAAPRAGRAPRARLARLVGGARAGFTLMEMMTAIALVVLVIIGVGILSKSMGSLVSSSQASNAMLSDVRAVQHAIERDFAGLSRDGFIVIRSRLDNGRRVDMISFIANGAFPNRTGTAMVGADSSGTTLSPPPKLLNGSTVATAALVWYGQLAIEPGAAVSGGNYLDPGDGSQKKLALKAPPSGVKDQDFILGRKATLLMAPSAAAGDTNRVTVYAADGSSVKLPAFDSPKYGQQIPATPSASPSDNGVVVDITSSRVAVAATPPSQVMLDVATNIGTSRAAAADARYEADTYCYRIHALQDVYGSDNNYAVNVLRMHPQLLQGCATFKVEWSDGTLDADNTIKWYGMGALKGDNAIEVPTDNANTKDDYTAIFSFDNKAKWPKAIRLSYRVVDRNNRLNGGRDFVQVIRLPN